MVDRFRELGLISSGKHAQYSRVPSIHHSMKIKMDVIIFSQRYISDNSPDLNAIEQLIKY